jgi:phenylalanyl-tRNA synthetase alpha chain
MRSALQRAKEHVLADHAKSGIVHAFAPCDQELISRLISISDLTEAEASENIISKVFHGLLASLEAAGFPNIKVVRGPKIVSSDDNFDALLFPPDNVGRSSTYTRWVDEDRVLRTHTSAIVPSLFRSLGSLEEKSTFVMPGLVYRRDVLDPRHLDVFHQVDVWMVQPIRQYGQTSRSDLLKLVQVVFDATVGTDAKAKVLETQHPYTTNGVEVYAVSNGRETEVLEAGLINPGVFRATGLDPKECSGLALGLGLERVVMIRKALPDIRLIRSKEPRVQAQLKNFEPYKKVSNHPPIKRDVSFCLNVGASEEDICVLVREAFGEAASLLEEVKLLARTPYSELEQIAVERLGARPGQDNVLVRITLRDPDQNIEKSAVDALYRNAYPKLHKGFGAGYR